jgi:tetratricopeptide (TPR) repeat protein
MSGKKSEKRKYPWYFYLLALMIPVVFFITLEGLLHLIGYGEEIQQWVEPSEKFSNYRMLNPEIARRYFKRIQKIPTPHFDAFTKQKSADTYRVFIIGGSTAAGFPYTMNGAFSRFVKRYLEIQYPAHNIEVVNLAISAVNSYTFRDLIPGIISQKPDLILIYAGHNEYYGALGVGSAQFWMGNRMLVNALLDASNVRILQLLRSIIISVRQWFTPRIESANNATLMESMVGKQLIPLHSRLYENGLWQFRDNMIDVIQLLKEADIPVVMSTLTSNLRDQLPFESAQIDTLPPAREFYLKAQKYLSAGKNEKAKDMFFRAKELDLLRFRAPEKINRIIKDLSYIYDIPLVQMDSVFSENSPDGIVGKELMTDHVHPKIFGIDLMGRAFTSVMEQFKIVPGKAAGIMTVSEAQDIASKTNTMTRLDSVYSDLRLSYLKGGWPFRKDGGPNQVLKNFKPADRIEELAFELLIDKVHWGEAHIRAGFWYKDRGNLGQFERELSALIEVMPYNEIPYKILIDGFIENNRLDTAFHYLQQLEKYQNTAYVKKWLGIYYLMKGVYDKAGRYLEGSVAQNERDAQALYNLAGVYIHREEYQKALDMINRCLAIDPNFQGARRTRDDLLRAVRLSESDKS